MNIRLDGGTGALLVTFFGATFPYDGSHNEHETQLETVIINLGVHMILLHLLNTLDCPKQRSGGQDMHISPNGRTGRVRVTFLSATLPHNRSHSDYETKYEN